MFNKLTPLEQRFEESLICFWLVILVNIELPDSTVLIVARNCVDEPWIKIVSEFERCLIHLSLLGTGKSQFLKFAAKLSNRSVITTGLGSTSAGLTVTAVKDGGIAHFWAFLLLEAFFCCNRVPIFNWIF